MNGRATSSRTQLLLAGALIGILLLFAVTQRAPSESRAFDITSAAPDGLLALRLWLDEMGYETQETAGATFTLSPETALLIIPPTNVAYTEAEAEQLHAWVAAGASVLIVGPHPRDEQLAKLFGVHPGEATPFLFKAQERQPLQPTIGEIDLSGAFAALDLSAAPAAVPFLVNGNGQITAAVQQYGAGTVWHVSNHHSFVNEQLRDPAQATLLLAMLRTIPAGGTIRFDTYHLWGATAGTPVAVRSLQEWLYYTTWGWALLFVLGISALVLVLQGHRLGPPLPAQAEVRRREAAEYVIAMANLARRARHRHVVADHHSRRLKRALGHRAQVDARLTNAEFVERLAAREVEMATTDPRAREVQVVLQQLAQADNDHELVTAVAEVDRLLTQRSHP
ncbi:MAG TPA: DUF4350 domain-containing protein [Caldilineaceae bacterium]|nr:DUF4350 domain-containing protein [Caldilineaceae bacterium]